MRKIDKMWIALMEFGHRIGCHQMESRSFSFQGYQFPVCARCTGVIFGELITIILLIMNWKIHWITAIILLLIMGLDWLIQFLNIKESNNIRRLITGFLGGVGLTFMYYYLVVYSLVLIR